MEYKKIKKFRDNVHGYINIPVEYVELFIDTDVFQRLRNIEQTSMRVLYPSARHDRFIHSLGTFHLGRKAIKNFRRNVRTNHNKLYKVFNDEERDKVFWDKCELLFNAACLLHDCGHAPFSHTFEFLYESELLDEKFDEETEKTKLQKELLKHLSSAEFKTDYNNQGTNHERMSALVVCTEFSDEIEKLLKAFGISDTKGCVEFVARMIIGCKYKHKSSENVIKNCIISLLNSTGIDVDGLDYIIRDSKLSGVDNISVDLERLLSALTIVEKTVFHNHKFYAKTSINGNLIDATIESDKNLNVYLNGCLMGETELNEFDAKMKGHISLTGFCKVGGEYKFSNNGIYEIGGTLVSNHKITEIVKAGSIEIIGEVSDSVELSGSDISTKPDFDSTVEITCKGFSSDSCYFNGELRGIFNGCILGDKTDLGGSLECEVGFHKSALSVVQNVLLARNYEYLWIYTHHKVVYYSNYLLVDIFIKSIEYIASKNGIKMAYEDILKEIFSYKLLIKNKDTLYPNTYNFNNYLISFPTDADIRFLIKKCYLLCAELKDEEAQVYKLLKELYNRRYKVSLWKSYAEYNIFFDNFSMEQKKKMFDFIKKESTGNTKKSKYGYLKEDLQKEFSKYGMDDVVWVAGSTKIKSLDLNSTYIAFKDDKVVNFTTAMHSKNIESENKLEFYYLFYKPIKGMLVEKKSINNLIRTKIEN